MHWLQTLDVSLFHWVNPTLSNSFLDVLMPFCSGNAYFVPALVLVCIGLIWRGGVRGRVCVLMIVLAVGLGDGLICNTLKHLIGRPRPFYDVLDAHVPASIGRTGSGSMPSSHAANWFAATMVVFIYYRRSLRFMLPMALLVSFSRVYNGVHYPSDVLAGAILGAGCAAAGVWTIDALWRWLGQRWFPVWWEQLPSLMDPVPVASSVRPATQSTDMSAARDRQWLYLGYALIGLHLIHKLFYISNGKLDLSEDEAYQWIWSKHLALSYYSKPLLIACTQFLGTSLWGDTVFGVRFFSPIIAATISFLMLRFLARTVNARAAFWVALLPLTVPLFVLGSTLMTIDPLSVLFWTMAMIAGWRAVQEDSRPQDWLWVGLWMGLGLLSKYTALFQWLCWVVFFVLWPPARKQLRRPGPYLALLINLICALPVLIWNYQHGWITIEHVASGGGLDKAWAFTPANLWNGFTRYTIEFVAVEALILNPFFFVLTAWAVIAFWRRRDQNPLLVYFFSMGAPLFLSYFLLSFRSRVQPNWIAPAVLPLFCLATVYWEQQRRTGVRSIKVWLIPGLVIGTVAMVLMHDTNLIRKVTGIPVPPKLDVLRRVKGWKETARLVEAARQKLLAEGKPVFIIGGHYGITSEVTFNLPEAKAAVCAHPVVYFQTAKTPQNQFYFWPGYQDRKGQSAIYVQELELGSDEITPPPEELKQEFDSVTDLGAVMVQYGGQPIRRIQIFECRGLH